MLNTTLRPFALLLILATLGVLFAGCSSDDDPISPEPSPGWQAMDLTPLADTYIDDNDTAATPGQGEVLRTGESQRAFLRFDLGSLPSGSVITGARLTLTQDAGFGSNDATDLVVRFTSDNDWSETSASADNPPGSGSLWLGSMSLGALSSGQNTVSIQTDEFRNKAGQQREFTGDLFSVQLSSDGNLSFLSSEAADADLRPTLELSYGSGHLLTLSPVDEAWVSRYDQERNFASSDSLIVDRSNYYTYLKFDLSEIPAGATVQLARLGMTARSGYAYGGDGNVYTYQAASDNWSGDTITYETRVDKTGNDHGYWWLWYNYTPGDRTGINDSHKLPSLIQGELDGDDVLSIELSSPGYKTVYYRSDAAESSFRPSLSVVYTTGD